MAESPGDDVTLDCVQLSALKQIEGRGSEAPPS